MNQKIKLGLLVFVILLIFSAVVGYLCGYAFYYKGLEDQCTNFNGVFSQNTTSGEVFCMPQEEFIITQEGFIFYSEKYSPE